MGSIMEMIECHFRWFTFFPFPPFFVSPFHAVLHFVQEGIHSYSNTPFLLRYVCALFCLWLRCVFLELCSITQELVSSFNIHAKVFKKKNCWTIFRRLIHIPWLLNEKFMHYGALHAFQSSITFFFFFSNQSTFRQEWFCVCNGENSEMNFCVIRCSVCNAWRRLHLFNSPWVECQEFFRAW